MTAEDELRKEIEALRRKVDYFKRRYEDLGGTLVQMDTNTSTLRAELEQKRRGFALLSALSVDLVFSNVDEAYYTATRRVNSALNMQCTVLLTPVKDNVFRPFILQGYNREEAAQLRKNRIEAPEEMLDPYEPLVITGEQDADYFADLRRDLGLKFFVSVPVIVGGDINAILVTGRKREQHPFLPRLGVAEVETVQAIAGFLSVLLAHKRLNEVSHMANHDALTGLPNLRLGKQRLDQAIAMARRTNGSVAIMFIDLDGFKAANDVLGHDVGDQVLVTVAERLRAAIRDVDTVIRQGGDEFLVILVGVEDRRGPEMVAVKLIEALAAEIPAPKGTAKIGASIGIAMFPDHGDSAESLLRMADMAMYNVKRKGKNNYAFAPLPVEEAAAHSPT